MLYHSRLQYSTSLYYNATNNNDLGLRGTRHRAEPPSQRSSNLIVYAMVGCYVFMVSLWFVVFIVCYVFMSLHRSRRFSSSVSTGGLTIAAGARRTVKRCERDPQFLILLSTRRATGAAVFVGASWGQRPSGRGIRPKREASVDTHFKC